MTKYPRGSEWRKWDLHIHTPGTAKNDLFPADIEWKEYLNALENNNDIAVLGVTDYFSIDNYLKLKSFQDSGRIQGKCLIPNIELRILPVTANETPINLHVLFDPALDIDCIKREFLRKLQFHYHGANFSCEKSDLIALGRQYKSDPALEEENAWREGIGQFNVSYDSVRTALAVPCLKGHFIIAVSNKSTDGNSGIQDSSLRANRQEIYRMADIILSGNTNDINYFLGKGIDTLEKVINDYGSIKPCIIGSDAHDIEHINVFPNSKITWIKADPTFDGLKQIIFEPEERVKIQEEQPEFKAMYNLLDSVSLDENPFWNQELLINANLTVIIGGRSTGKSTLLESIARKIAPDKFKQNSDNESNIINRNQFFTDHINKVSVSWSDKSVEGVRDVDYFPQSHMYEIARSKLKVDELIQKLVLETPENADLLHTFENEIKVNRDAIIGNCENLYALQKNLTEYTEKVKTIGNVKGIQEVIDQLHKNANELKVSAGISEEELRDFETKRESLSSEKHILEMLQKDKVTIEGFKNKSILDSSFRYAFNVLSEDKRNHFETAYDQFSAKVKAAWDKHIDTQLQQLQAELSASQARIQTIEADPIFQKGMQYISANKQYSIYQERIAAEKEKLKDAESTTQKRDLLLKQIDKLKEEITTLHLDFGTKITEMTSQVHLDVGDLSINAKPVLRTNDLKSFLEPRLIKRSDAQKEMIAELSDSYLVDTEVKIKNFFNGILDGSIQYTAGNNTQNILSDFLAMNWYNISYDLAYQADGFYNMSPGKQAFVILKLLLEFSSRKCPILIDQPEDSLDNRAIYTELVAYLKTKKKERQIILVSHNPNVVVGADAEQVIVANQHGNNSPNTDNVRFRYYSGALEDSHNDPSIPTILESQGIREHVCDILEGGQEAFNRREKKYGFHK